MVVLSHSFRYFYLALLMCGLEQSARTQAQTNQVPANYRGPDTYGMCAYVIGDTEYYGRTFYTSSYFKAKAEQEIRAYAQSQSPGATAKAQCAWSFRESDLALMKETDRRLIGLPGHPAKSEESNWTFHGGTVGSGGASSASSVGPSSATASPASASSPGASQASSTISRGASGSRAYGNGAVTTAATGSTGPYGASSTAGSLTGGAQQSISDAKANMVSTAASGMTTATNSAVSALSSGMQNMFHHKQAQPQGQSNSAPAGGNQAAGQTQTVASGGAAPEGFGFVADGSAAKGSAGAAGGSPIPAAASSMEGVVADVSGKDVIINIGSQAGVKPGATLAVMHPQRTVNDPVTGKRLRTVEAEVGELRITSADSDSASGTFSGAGVPVVGDKVRPKQ